jgi:cystathionine beta-synthase
MKLYDISQLPVIDEDRIIGIIDESDILTAVTDKKDHSFSGKVGDNMTRDIESVSPDASIDAILTTLKKGFTVIVRDKNKFYGLITRIDMLNYFRKINS